MSIKSDVEELKTIQAHLKTLQAQRKELVTRKKVLEENISNFLKEKDQVGVKYQDVNIILQEKEQHKYKKAKDKDAASIDILVECGVRHPEELLKKLMEARKGSPVPVTKIKMEKARQ